MTFLYDPPMRLQAVILICSLAACAGRAADGTASSPEPEARARTSTPEPGVAPAPVVAQQPHTELVPDPITRPLDESDARAEADRIVRREFARRTDILDAAGHRVMAPEFGPAQYVGGLHGDRWEFRGGSGLDGSWATVSFGRWRDHVQVEVGFSPD